MVAISRLNLCKLSPFDCVAVDCGGSRSYRPNSYVVYQRRASERLSDGRGQAGHAEGD